MNKPTKKRINYNEDILNVLIAKYDFTADYIRKSIRGDRNGIMPDRIKQEYKKLLVEDEQLKTRALKTLQEKANKLN